VEEDENVIVLSTEASREFSSRAVISEVERIEISSPV
jgi:hypothetical protein